MVLGSPSFALDWQPYIKVNVPSLRTGSRRTWISAILRCALKRPIASDLVQASWKYRGTRFEVVQGSLPDIWKWSVPICANPRAEAVAKGYNPLGSALRGVTT